MHQQDRKDNPVTMDPSELYDVALAELTGTVPSRHSGQDLSTLSPAELIEVVRERLDLMRGLVQLSLFNIEATNRETKALQKLIEDTRPNLAARGIDLDEILDHARCEFEARELAAPASEPDQLSRTLTAPTQLIDAVQRLGEKGPGPWSAAEQDRVASLTQALSHLFVLCERIELTWRGTRRENAATRAIFEAVAQANATS